MELDVYRDQDGEVRFVDPDNRDADLESLIEKEEWVLVGRTSIGLATETPEQ